RNADWMKKREPQTTVTEKFGLQVMAPSKARDKQTSRIDQAPPAVEDDSDVDEETYERVPIESFGAAMLRGMGWKEESDNTTIVSNNSRPSLLGLGAKALEKK
ncbi:DNA primase large subunit Spp2, partial [Coemansia sp. S2]